MMLSLDEEATLAWTGERNVEAIDNLCALVLLLALVSGPPKSSKVLRNTLMKTTCKCIRHYPTRCEQLRPRST